MATEDNPAAPRPPSDQRPPSAVLPEQVPLEASLRGKVYAVTGGSSGIGSSVVLALAAAGASVAFSGRDPDRLARVAATAAALATTPDAAVLATAIDVTDEAAVDVSSPLSFPPDLHPAGGSSRERKEKKNLPSSLTRY